jgi:plastocyanin
VRIRLVALAAMGALVAVGLASAMTVPKLNGTVGPGYTISFKRVGKSVKTLTPGKYTFVVKDKSSIHNFTLDGGGFEDKVITGTAFTGTKNVTLRLKKGSYKVYCTIHPTIVHRFKVT